MECVIWGGGYPYRVTLLNYTLFILNYKISPKGSPLQNLALGDIDSFWFGGMGGETPHHHTLIFIVIYFTFLIHFNLTSFYPQITIGIVFFFYGFFIFKSHEEIHSILYCNILYERDTDLLYILC